jgi:hypothetical protein
MGLNEGNTGKEDLDHAEHGDAVRMLPLGLALLLGAIVTAAALVLLWRGAASPETIALPAFSPPAFLAAGGSTTVLLAAALLVLIGIFVVLLLLLFCMCGCGTATFWTALRRALRDSPAHIEIGEHPPGGFPNLQVLSSFSIDTEWAPFGGQQGVAWGLTFAGEKTYAAGDGADRLATDCHGAAAGLNTVADCIEAVQP